MSMKQNEPTLKEKYDLIKKAEQNPGMSSRSLADLYKCGKRQVCNTLKKKIDC